MKRELTWIAKSGTAVAPVGARTRNPWPVRITAAAGVLIALAIGLAVGGRYLSTVATPAALVRFEVQPPADVTLTPSPIAFAAQLALSPDGRRLAFVAARRHGCVATLDSSA